MGLKFIYSAMNSGKSTLLLQTAYSARSKGFEVILVGFKGNTRETTIKSRLGVEYEVDLFFDGRTNMKKALKKEAALKGKHKVLAILIDEAQFLTPKQVEELVRFTIETSIPVECYGLKTNFATRLFPGSQRLLELADEVEELALVRCSCGNKASINARFNSKGEIVTSGPEKLIEGSKETIIYDPVCSSCFLDHAGTLSPEEE